MDSNLLPQNIILPLSTCFHNRVHILFLDGILMNNVRECLTMIGHLMSMLSEDCIDSIIWGICLKL